MAYCIFNQRPITAELDGPSFHLKSCWTILHLNHLVSVVCTCTLHMLKWLSDSWELTPKMIRCVSVLCRMLLTANRQRIPPTKLTERGSLLPSSIGVVGLADRQATVESAGFLIGSQHEHCSNPVWSHLSTFPSFWATKKQIIKQE